MVEGMSVVVNVMLGFMIVMSTPCLVQPIGAHSGDLMYFGSFCFRGGLGFLNFDDICMYVVNKQFVLLDVASNPVYVDLKYNEISLNFTSGYVGLCGVCIHVVVLGLLERLSWYLM